MSWFKSLAHKMPRPQISYLNESDIPAVPLLYQTNKLTPSPKPLFAPDAAINAKIGLIRTDITKIHLPNGAIVNAANEALSPGGGVCGAIHSAAGYDLADECKMHRGCETGHAKITRAYELLCKRIIHAVGPIYWLTKPSNSHARLLESCYSEVLKLCVANGLTSVAFCALSTGIYGYPSYEAAESALKAVRTFLETDKGKKMEFVIFCNFEKKDQDAYLDLISTYFPPVEPEDKAKETAESSEAAAAEPTKTDAHAESVLPDPAAKDTDPTAEPTDAKAEPAAAAKTDTPKQEAAPVLPKPADDDETDDFVLIDMEDAEYKPKK